MRAFRIVMFGIMAGHGTQGKSVGDAFIYDQAAGK